MNKRAVCAILLKTTEQGKATDLLWLPTGHKYAPIVVRFHYMVIQGVTHTMQTLEFEICVLPSQQ